MGGVCSEPAERRPPQPRHRGAAAAVLPRRYLDPALPANPAAAEDEDADPDAPWDQNFPRMTQAELARRREVFWETRVEGQAHLWQALKLSIEAEDDATARVILESVGMTPLDFASDYVFSYDDRGRRYDVPMFVLYAPRNLITEEVKLEEAKSRDAADPRAARPLTFRVRLSLPGPELQVTCKDTTTMGQIKRKIAKLKDIAVERQMVIYRGRGCPDDFTLRALDIAANTAVQIMVKSALQQPSVEAQATEQPSISPPTEQSEGSLSPAVPMLARPPSESTVAEEASFSPTPTFDPSMVPQVIPSSSPRPNTLSPTV